MRRSLDNKGLTVVLSTAGEFLKYYQKVDSGLDLSESRKSQNTGLVARLEHIIQQIQLRESTLL